jgi:diguanylate cyclase (GGDEF)-like protein
MEETLETSILTARRDGGQLALLYVDLNGFKQINDRFSHRVGDLFLCEIAKRMSAAIQSEGIAARVGGDEFTILITECASVKAAGEIADRVLRLARQPLSIEGHSFCFSASIGVSLFPNDAHVPDQLVRAADLAMYAAKSSGKNKVCFFEAVRDQRGIRGEPDAGSIIPQEVTADVV